MAIGTNKSVLIYDLETTSANPETAELKWFGAFSFKNNKYYEYDYNKKDEISRLIKDHKVLVGFNNRDFDNPILARFIPEVEMTYKVIVDLFQVCKLRLGNMGVRPRNLKLKTIIEFLKLDDDGTKGEIDYTIFQKDEWTNAEIFEIQKYLRQDIKITKALFEWFFEQFKPIRKYLTQKDKDNYNDIKSSTASLAYRVICSMSGLKAEFTDSKPDDRIKIAGGHHVLPRIDRARGHIVSVDFTSAYPHAIMMGNLLSRADKKEEGWTGGDYYNLGGRYKIDEMGKKEQALRQIFLERLKAKKAGDKTKTLSYKIIINSLYGTLGHTAFKHTYDPIAAGDTTAMARTWMKMLGKTLEEHGFFGIYGFTDSVAVLIPDHLDKNHLMMAVNKFVKDVYESAPFPQDTFGLEVDKEMQFLWIIAKNCYLWVDLEGKVGYRATLFNKNVPHIIMKLFEDYMAPKIVESLDVKFTDRELREKLKEYLAKDIKSAGEEKNIKELSDYKSKTSIQYQISKVYGAGQHLMIPNLKGVGIGKAKGTKSNAGVRWCTYDDYVDNKLLLKDIDLGKLMKPLKPFISKVTKDSLLQDFLGPVNLPEPEEKEDENTNPQKE